MVTCRRKEIRGMRKVIKWTNKISGETGYVQSVLKSKGHFINTWDKETAKVYKGQKMLDNDLKALEEIGETKDNFFEVIDVA